ncbi:putative Exopolysaccharide production protein exoZ [Bradyrhizobium sp. STM 3843]|uniref:acyltransferase family protein n=1 Tax=Bradyrhizobium sp. STM 3843 TaxID=551947 RepID=UPI000240534D|nr:acyltransferase [Bradyrhizobium sp. STM 3843]CCE09393.1 putative Exopolysaccharide production protein exoZ [Bradyrhizobium sp. STM 3843]
MKKEVIAIQYLRGIAAMMVVVHHMLSPTTRIDYLSNSNLGPFGVKLFFVISGFIMWYTTANSNISPVAFWRRRIARIVPLYWIFLAILIGAALRFPNLFHTTVITPENATKSFLFIPHFHVVQTGLIAPILIPGWSLNYEMFFYFVFGFLLLVGSRTVRITVLGLGFLALVLLGFAVQPADAVLSTYTNPDLLKFLYGASLAILYQAGALRSPVLGVALLATGVLSFLLVPASSELARINDLLGISATTIVAGALALEDTVRRAPSLILRTIGDASYSIYLSHLFILRVTELLGEHLSLFGSGRLWDAIYLAGTLTSAVVGGICIHYLLERPLASLGTGRRRILLNEPA